MSLWGDKELIAGANSGTIELANTTSGVVTGTGTDFVTDIFTGNAVTTAFTLSRPPAPLAQVILGIR